MAVALRIFPPFAVAEGKNGRIAEALTKSTQ
jgi:hypothetical protein